MLIANAALPIGMKGRCEMNRPLVSLVVATYNQEQYVRDTINSALMQTYNPLEIIISDDCSTDSTAEIIKTEVDAYRRGGGEHKVVFNRNKCNLGIAQNWQEACGLANGELIVAMGGDDISLPQRVSRIVEEWERNGRTALALYHGAVTINHRGEEVGELGEFYFAEGTLGAVAAYSKKIWEYFGPISETEAVEDEVFGNRALIFSARQNIRENLLKYRIGVGVSSGMRDYRKKQIKVYKRYKLSSLRQTMRDLDKVRRVIGEEEYSRLEKLFVERRNENEMWLRLFSENSFVDRLNAAKYLCPRISLKRKVLVCVLLLPKIVGDVLFSVLRVVMNK